jgi:hypothetical protein
VLVVGAIAGVGCASLTTGREGSSWRLHGSVVRVSSSELDVRHKSGRVVSLALDSDTTIEHDGVVVDRRVLAARQRVTIRVDTAGRARRVQIHSAINRGSPGT